MEEFSEQKPQETQPLQDNNSSETPKFHEETDCCCASDSKKIKLSLILNVLLIIAVIVLYFIHFTDREKVSATSPAADRTPSEYAIAYVNSDTLMAHYTLFETYKNKLERRKEELEKEMSQKARNFEREVNDFQQKVQSYSITSDQAQKMEADLIKKQEQLMELRERMSNELIEMEYEHQSLLFKSIIDALKVYNEAHDFDYILGYSQGSGILLANEKFDITPEILEILNKK